MVTADRIIVLKYVKYSDSSIIVQALSQKHGRVSLMVRGLGKNRTKLGAFHPLALLDAVYSYREDRQVQRLSEYKPNPLLANCTTDLRKSTQLMFLAEVVGKSVMPETPDSLVFAFVEQSIMMLEEMEKGLAEFHIAFLVKLSQFLGFHPGQESVDMPFFDLTLGHGVEIRPHHKHYIGNDLFKKMYRYFDLKYSELDVCPLSKTDRDFLLDVVVMWYANNIVSMADINSHEILHQVFN